MPLPFSFSTQRHSFDSDTAGGTGGSAVHEVIMQSSPGPLSTEPLLGTPGNSLTPPQVAEERSAAPERMVLGPMMLPPAPSPNQRVIAPPPELLRQVTLVDDTLSLPPPAPVMQAPARAATAPLVQAAPEWTTQLDQLRNDIFSIAMSVSAMNDRIDRLDRAPQAASVSLATLRGEIQSWLENHLNAAVEHCMHRIISRVSQPAAPH